MEETNSPELNDPVMLVSLSTSVQQYRVLYSQARELGKFLLKRVEFKRLSVFYSSSMPPLVLISDEGIIRLSSTSFHHHAAKRDVVLLAGDASPVEGQYEFCDTVLKYAKKLGVKELVSIGTRWTEEAASPTGTPRVKGFATDAAGVKDLEGWGVEIIRDEPAPFFASLVVGLASRHGMTGYKLSVDHGEPIPHPRSVMELLAILKKMVGIEVQTAELSELATKMAANLEPSASNGGQPPRGSGVYG